MKKLISILLTAIMLMTSVVFTTAYGAEADAALNNSSVELLNVLDIRLPEERANEQFITRGEFVYLAMTAAKMTFGTHAEYLEFPDVKLDMYLHDAVVSARALGIVAPKADETFGLNDYITADYAARTALAVLGYTNIQEDGKALNNASIGVYNELVKAAGNDAYLSFESGEKVIYEMLLSPYVEKVGYGEENNYTLSGNKLFMESVYALVKERGRLTGTQYTKFGGGKTTKNQIEINGKIFESACGDVSDYLGYSVEYYVQDGDKSTVICVVPSGDNDITVIKSGELADVVRSGADMTLTYQEEGKSKLTKLKVPFSSDFIYNGEVQGISTDKIKSLISAKDGDIQIVENSYGTTITEYAYETLILSSVSENLGQLFGKNSKTIALPENTYNNVRVFSGNEEIALSDLKAGDFIMTAKSGDLLKIVVSNNIISGCVEQLSDNSVVIDGVKYEYSNSFSTAAAADPAYALKLDLDANFYFDIYGKLSDYDEDHFVKTGEYVYLIKSGIDTRSGLSQKGQIKAVDMNGNMKIYTLAEKVKGNDGKKTASEIIVALGTARELIYIETNTKGEISRLMKNDGDYISKDAAEEGRKFKRGASAFLDTISDATFPEFYVNANTKVLQVPVSDAADDVVNDKDNYKKLELYTELSDADERVVEAYNFDDFNVAEILIIKRENSVTWGKQNDKVCLVTGVGSIMNAEGNTVPLVKGYSGGAEVSIELKSDDVLKVTVSEASRNITKGDIVRFHANGNGIAEFSEYINNIEAATFAPMAAPSGVNNGNAYAIGTIVDRNETYIKLKMSDGTERVFFNLMTPTIYNSATDKARAGTIADLGPNQLVMLRVFYTSVQDIIIKE